MEEGWEGCLSVPGLRGAVSRYTLIRYEGIDPQGARIDRRAEGFHARVVQHECDHLIGRLYPSRITRSEEHTSELQSLMRISYAVFCLKKKNRTPNISNYS